MIKKRQLKEIDSKQFFLVNNGVIILLLVGLLTFIGLSLLRIDNQSILELVIDYYLKNHSN